MRRGFAGAYVHKRDPLVTGVLADTDGSFVATLPSQPPAHNCSVVWFLAQAGMFERKPSCTH